MIIPTRCMSAKFWFDCIEGKAEYHPIEKRIHFKRNGRDIGPAMQAYVCIIYRAKSKQIDNQALSNSVKTFN